MKKIAIIGAGISGLFIANLFKRNTNYQITIFEKNASISLEEGYGVQLSVNSVRLLNEIGFEELQKNEKFTPEKIDFYSINDKTKICELDISEFNSKDCKYTTLKRSSLVNFLKKDLLDTIKTNSDISKIDQMDKKVRLSFENNNIDEFDYLIIADGVFSKSKGLVSKKKIQPKYNNTLAIRGILNKPPENIVNRNINLFLGFDFHHVIYPVNSSGEFNFIAIMKYNLTEDDQKNYSLYNDKNFIKKILENIPKESQKLLEEIKELKVFPVFTSNNFFRTKNDNIHIIGDAFFAFPPSFAQGASQSIEAAYELFKAIENNTELDFFKHRVRKTKMVNTRSKINQFAFHLSNPFTTFVRNIFLKRLVKNKKFLKIYLGKIYR